MNWTVENGEHVAKIKTDLIKVDCKIWEGLQIREHYYFDGIIFINAQKAFIIIERGKNKADVIAKIEDVIKSILKKDMQKIIKEIDR